MYGFGVGVNSPRYVIVRRMHMVSYRRGVDGPL